MAKHKRIGTRVEIRDGKEYTVTVYEDDFRTKPEVAKDRVFFNAASPAEQRHEVTRREKAKARERRRKRAKTFKKK